MKESIFASEMRKSFLKHTPFYLKIPDSYGMDRFSTVKNFDALSIVAGTPYAIEYKLQKKKGSFPFSRLRDIQIDSLYNVYKAGGQGLIIINFRWAGFNKALAIDIVDFKDMIEYYTKDLNRKSIPWSEIGECLEKKEGKLSPYAYVLERKKYEDGTFWDIEQLL